MMPTELSPTLTTEERAEFTLRDIQIRRGLKSFLEVGTALVVIHEKRLYREDFATFNDYCEHAGLSRSRAYQLIDSITTVMQLEARSVSPQDAAAIETLKDSAEHTALELSKVPERSQQKVLNKAVAISTNKTLTPEDIAQAAKKVSKKANVQNLDISKPLTTNKSVPTVCAVGSETEPLDLDDLPPESAPPSVRSFTAADVRQIISETYNRLSPVWNAPPPPPPRKIIDAILAQFPD